MDYLSIDQVSGDMIGMKRTDAKHLNREGYMETEKTDKGTGFNTLLTDALGKVNDQQQYSANLIQQMITRPDSVDAHDVSIAIAKANTSLTMTKSIVDAALKAYREIISIR